MEINHINNKVASPGDFIRAELKSRGWGQDDLARVMDRPTSRISELVQGKLAITAEVAVSLASALGGNPEEWLQREANYRLSLISSPASEEVRRRSRAYSLAPVKELQKRGWISAGEDIREIERQLLGFFEIKSLDEEPAIQGAMQKTAPCVPVTPAQRAWAFQVRKLATAISAPTVQPYDESKLENCWRDLRKLAAYSAESRKAPDLLMSYGIRFVVVEGLSGGKVDGFATWLDADSPVIGMSLRYDKLESFWSTLGHELTHIKYRDVAPIDYDVSGYEELPLDVKPPIERRANEESAAMFVPPEELESFIQRIGPLYSTEKINQFANRIKMHPRIIIHQLKNRGEIGHSSHNKNNVPVRDVITKAAVTDGWGKTVDLGVNS